MIKAFTAQWQKDLISTAKVIRGMYSTAGEAKMGYKYQLTYCSEPLFPQLSAPALFLLLIHTLCHHKPPIDHGPRSRLMRISSLVYHKLRHHVPVLWFLAALRIHIWFEKIIVSSLGITFQKGENVFYWSNKCTAKLDLHMRVRWKAEPVLKFPWWNILMNLIKTYARHEVCASV